MRTFARYALLIGAVALLAACGASPPPIATPRASSVRPRSWIAANASTKDLLYIVYPTIGSRQGVIAIYSYPQGVLAGQITGLSAPDGACSDKYGNIYITNYRANKENTLVEFAHGGTQPVRKLKIPSGANPVSCAVDPKSGDLAVTNYGNTAGAGANVLIYRKGKGRPTSYTSAQFLNYAYCTYDNAGNLFIDGKYPGGYETPIFGEIPRGSASIETINLNYGIGWLSNLQWDDKYLAVGQGVKPYIFRFAINGTSGTLVGSTPLTDATWLEQFVLAGKRAIAVNIFFHDRYEYEYDVLVYDYPPGGYSTEQIAYNIGGGDISSIALSRNK